MMPIIEVDQVTKAYANHLALDNLSFSIPEGTIFGLLGPNGAGKTTLIRMLNQITAPDSGIIRYHGHPLCRADIENVGYLPEERGLYKKMKISEQVVYLAQLKGLSKKEAVSRLQHWFQKFEIESWWDKRVTDLSKGMQQKIQFIVTIVHQPDFLIFDEPFSGFDPINTELLKQEILELKRNGATVVLSTHNMNSVEEICDHIVLLNRGIKVMEGNLYEVKKQFATRTYRVTVPADRQLKNFPPYFEILTQEEKNHEVTYTVHIVPEKSSNQLLEWLVSETQVIDFNEIIPSMNDIFIRTITQQNHQ